MWISTPGAKMDHGVGVEDSISLPAQLQVSRQKSIWEHGPKLPPTCLLNDFLAAILPAVGWGVALDKRAREGERGRESEGAI